MRKTLTIARREFGAMVATKAFLFSIVLMPILMFGGIAAAALLGNVSEAQDKKLVIIDQTGGAAFEALELAAREHNAAARRLRQPAAGDAQPAAKGRLTRFLLEREPQTAPTDADRLRLSKRVESGEIDAFVEIPAAAFATEAGAEPAEVRYYSQQTPLAEARQWIEGALNQIVRGERLRRLHLDAELVRRATQPVPIKSYGLVQESATGGLRPAAQTNDLTGIFVPFGLMLLMFMVIMLTAQPALETVLEEKGNRIAELLLGSANPFQLMAGKLLGTVAGSVCVFSIYFAGALGMAWYKGWTDQIPFDLAPWFVAYQILAVLFFNAIFLAIGASVNQLKEAQSLLLPVWLLLSLPMFVWFNLVREPTGRLATGLSFFPPATPMVMVLRLATKAPLPAWQPWAGLAVLALATVAVVYAAGRIFRIGILWQGASPKLRDLARWALSG